VPASAGAGLKQPQSKLRFFLRLLFLPLMHCYILTLTVR
jgi:hypothetical protein